MITTWLAWLSTCVISQLYFLCRCMTNKYCRCITSFWIQLFIRFTVIHTCNIIIQKLQYITLYYTCLYKLNTLSYLYAGFISLSTVWSCHGHHYIVILSCSKENSCSVGGASECRRQDHRLTGLSAAQEKETDGSVFDCQALPVFAVPPHCAFRPTPNPTLDLHLTQP